MYELVIITCGVSDYKTHYAEKGEYSDIYNEINRIIKEYNLKYLDSYETDYFSMTYHLKSPSGDNIVSFREKANNKEIYEAEDIRCFLEAAARTAFRE